MEQFEPMSTDVAVGSSSEYNNCYGFVFIDMVGFNNGHHFICQEFSLVADDYEYHTLIKPPYGLDYLPLHERQKELWEIEHLHGLRYDGGTIDLTQLVEMVYPHIKSKRIIVENDFKRRLLKDMFTGCGEIDCIKIRDMGFDTDLQGRDEYPICNKHNKLFAQPTCECALSTALKLRDITESNIYHVVNVEQYSSGKGSD